MKKRKVFCSAMMICLSLIITLTGCNGNKAGSAGDTSGTASSQVKAPGTSTVRDLGGYINVRDMGAVPNDLEDDTQAFVKAAMGGRGIYVPEGIYYISKPIVLNNQNIMGTGMFATQIISRNEKPEEPIIKAGRSSVIADLSIGFEKSKITGSEKEGQRVGIYTGAQWSLQRGATVRNVRIAEVGTGIYSPTVENAASFSVTYDTLEISDFTYRGIDFRSTIRTGNVYSNIYIMSNKPNVDAMFALQGEESEAVIHQLNVEHTKCKSPIIFRGVRALAASSIHIEGVAVTEPGNGMIRFENSNGSIEALSVYYSPIDVENSSIIKIGDALYQLDEEWAKYKPNNMQSLRIGTFHVKGINDPNGQIHGARDDGLANKNVKNFHFIDRSQDANGDFSVRIDSYVWYTFKSDKSIYGDFPVDPYGRITFTKKGELPAGGTTAERPRQRLCKFYTRYFDTEVGRELIWDGANWR